MASNKKGLPAVIYTKVGPAHVTILELSTTSEAEDRIMELCGGDKKKKKHYQYIVTEMTEEAILLNIGKTIPIENLVSA